MFELLLGQEFCEDVRDVFLLRDVAELDDVRGGLFAEPGHPDAEMTVAGRNDMILDHCDSSLVIFENDAWEFLRETDFFQHATEPQNVFHAFVRGDEFCLRSTLAHHGRCFSSPYDWALGQHDNMTAARAMSQVLNIAGVDEC